MPPLLDARCARCFSLPLRQESSERGNLPVPPRPFDPSALPVKGGTAKSKVERRKAEVSKAQQPFRGAPRGAIGARDDPAGRACASRWGSAPRPWATPTRAKRLQPPEGIIHGPPASL